MSRSFTKLVRLDVRRQVERFYMRQNARNRKNSYQEFPVLDGHGRERWIGLNAQVLMKDNEVVGFQAITRDLTERARHVDGSWVWFSVRESPFTRDANDRVVQIVGSAQDVSAHLHRASMEHMRVSLCLFDIDLFKEINDRFGHAASDEVLEAVGAGCRSGSVRNEPHRRAIQRFSDIRNRGLAARHGSP